MSRTKARKKTLKKYAGRGDFKEKPKLKPCFDSKKVKKAKILSKIISLRGIFCFYCGCEMRQQDITIEHLKAKSNGGTNSIYNLYLAHEWCNKEAGSKYTKDKGKMRAIRTEEAWHKCF